MRRGVSPCEFVFGGAFTLEAQAAELRSKVGHSGDIGATVRTAQMLLEELRTRLDMPVTWEVKRRLIEVLVGGIRVETVDGDEGKLAKTTVSYRFNPPGGMPLILPQSYGARSTLKEPATIGDHVRKRRIALKLRQRDVAEQVGVDVTTVRNWEGNRTAPDFRAMPAIIQFLGNNPMPEPTAAPERLV